jgi:hypothetical protein
VIDQGVNDYERKIQDLLDLLSGKFPVNGQSMNDAVPQLNEIIKALLQQGQLSPNLSPTAQQFPDVNREPVGEGRMDAADALKAIPVGNHVLDRLRS